MFQAVVAVDSQNGIAAGNHQRNSIPWKHHADMKHFRNLTANGVVIMGGKTYRSIGKSLPNRINCIISHRTICPRDQNENSTFLVFRDPWQCVRWCNRYYKNKNVFVIGGSEIYKWFYDNDLLAAEYVTRLEADYKCVKFYPNTDAKMGEAKQLAVFDETGNLPRSVIYLRKHYNKAEENMLAVATDILMNGDISNDRTGVGTKSLFGRQLRFDLTNNNFPLMTTRPVPLRLVFEELMWNLRGQTDAKILSSKRVKIWEPNTTREFLDNRGLNHLPVGDIGHSYGFSMRHYGADYKDCTVDYKDQGYDQLRHLVVGLRNKPYSRRHMISLWEPNKQNQAALPPCLYNYQFYVRDGYLSCMMSQRSSDYAVAGGWNVAYGALFTYLLANQCRLKPRELIWNLGDVHIYNNCSGGMDEQVIRKPTNYPKLFIRNAPTRLTLFEFVNLELINYHPSDKIAFPMNV